MKCGGLQKPMDPACRQLWTRLGVGRYNDTRFDRWGPWRSRISRRIRSTPSIDKSTPWKLIFYVSCSNDGSWSGVKTFTRVHILRPTLNPWRTSRPACKVCSKPCESSLKFRQNRPIPGSAFEVITSSLQSMKLHHPSFCPVQLIGILENRVPSRTKKKVDTRSVTPGDLMPCQSKCGS